MSKAMAEFRIVIFFSLFSWRVIKMFISEGSNVISIFRLISFWAETTERRDAGQVLMGMRDGELIIFITM